MFDIKTNRWCGIQVYNAIFKIQRGLYKQYYGGKKCKYSCYENELKT